VTWSDLIESLSVASRALVSFIFAHSLTPSFCLDIF
jgi:hypothetical protein